MEKKTLKQLVEEIEAGNEQFEKLPKSKKRVVIAQDCLDRIDIGHLRPRGGRFINDEHLSYLVTGDYYKSIGKIKNVESCSLKTKFNEIPQCSACAKGSLFLSLVGRVNKFDINDINFDNNNSSHDKSHAKLLEIFDLKQLALIEFAFEGSQYIRVDSEGKDIKFSNKTKNKIHMFHNSYYGSTDLMVAICKNIIENKGTFKL